LRLVVVSEFAIIHTEAISVKRNLYVRLFFTFASRSTLLRLANYIVQTERVSLLSLDAITVPSCCLFNLFFLLYKNLLSLKTYSWSRKVYECCSLLIKCKIIMRSKVTHS
jgi:hypothetical protein